MTLTVLMFVLVLAAGDDGGNWAGAEKTSQGGEAAPRAAASDLPDLEIQAWALVDIESGWYLAGENPDEPLPTASTANVMTALVALEKGIDLDEEVTVPRRPSPT
jgi:D-alanyl-D-alanine carboxypeptidase